MTRAAMLCGGTCGRSLAKLREVFEPFWGGPAFCYDCAYCETCEEYFCGCKFVWVEPAEPMQQEMAL